MKKKIIISLASFGLMLTPVSAEPVQVTGDVSAKYQRNTADGEATSSGGVYTLRLMCEADLGSGWSLYTRLGAQGLSRPGLGDFNTADSVYGEDKETVAELDQYGLIYNTGGLTYKLGRQDATVGVTALLYSRPDTDIGKKAFVDGLSLSGSVGSVDIAALAAREDNPSGEPKSKLYALRAGYNPMENLNIGLTLGRYSSETSTNHWALDGTYIFGKNSLTAEYTKASSDSADKAFAVIWAYEFDDRISASVTGFRVEEFGSMGGQSDFDPDNRGVHYALSYKLGDADGLDLVYKSQKTISGGQNNSQFEATLTHTF